MTISMIICLSLTVFFILVFLWDNFQKEHSILRTYPVFGYLRIIAEHLGIYLRRYLYSRDREELPFNRAERIWVYQAAKNAETLIGFGSTRDLRQLGRIFFVDVPFPVQTYDSVKTAAVVIGSHTPNPYTTTSIINISAMSYGAISRNAIRALGAGAKLAGCWLNTGEGGISPYHLESGCDLVVQIGTAKYGFRDAAGNLSDQHLKEAAALPQVKMFEIKISQGAKPGKGGILPAAKVTEEIAVIRGIPAHQDAVSPNGFTEVTNTSQLIDFINHVRDVTCKPTGFKIDIGSPDWLDELWQEILNRGIDSAPDFITVDGAEGGSGAAPEVLASHMGLSIAESLPMVVDSLNKHGLRERVKVIAAGKLITPDKVAWALCMGADFVNTARGFMFALGCVQAMKCHLNTCPTGIATHNAWLMRGLDPTNKAVRVYQYAKNMEYEVGIICHSCGVHEPRELRRHHIRVVTARGTSVSMADVYPET